VGEDIGELLPAAIQLAGVSLLTAFSEDEYQACSSEPCVPGNGAMVLMAPDFHCRLSSVHELGLEE
jgi:hypothetical protein